MLLSGWIKLHRKLLEHPVASNAKYLSVWVHLLLKANHKEKQFIFNDKTIKLKSGELITSLKKLAEQTGINLKTVYRILKWMEKEKLIVKESSSKFTKIKILNWEKYQVENKCETDLRQKCDKIEKQDEKQEVVLIPLNIKDCDDEVKQDEKQIEKQMRNERETNEKQSKTNKNIKNEKNINNNNSSSKKAKKKKPEPVIFNFETRELENLTDDDLELWKNAYPDVNVEIELKRIIAWIVSNPKKIEKRKDLRRTITNWLSSEQKKIERGIVLNEKIKIGGNVKRMDKPAIKKIFK